MWWPYRKVTMELQQPSRYYSGFVYRSVLQHEEATPLSLLHERGFLSFKGPDTVCQVKYNSMSYLSYFLYKTHIVVEVEMSVYSFSKSLQLVINPATGVSCLMSYPKLPDQHSHLSMSKRLWGCTGLQTSLRIYCMCGADATGHPTSNSKHILATQVMQKFTDLYLSCKQIMQKHPQEIHNCKAIKLSITFTTSWH